MIVVTKVEFLWEIIIKSPAISLLVSTELHFVIESIHAKLSAT